MAISGAFRPCCALFGRSSGDSHQCHIAAEQAIEGRHLVRHIWALRPLMDLAISAQWLSCTSCSRSSSSSSPRLHGTFSARSGSSFLRIPTPAVSARLCLAHDLWSQWM